jgi:hypothetical protein
VSALDVPRSTPRSARLQLIDLHFEVRDTSAEMLSAPTPARRVALQRAVHRFLAAERLFASMGESDMAGSDLDARRTELVDGLVRLDTASTEQELYEAGAAVRHTFLQLCEPLWHAKDLTDGIATPTT